MTRNPKQKSTNISDLPTRYLIDIHHVFCVKQSANAQCTSLLQPHQMSSQRVTLIILLIKITYLLY